MTDTTKNANEEQDPEIIESAKQIVRDFVHCLAAASPETAESMVRRLESLCRSDKVLPVEFKQKALRRARDLACDANMRRCDQLLREVMSLSVAGKMTERSVKLIEARSHFSRACALGAEMEWRKAFRRADETLQLTGTQQQASKLVIAQEPGLPKGMPIPS